MQLYLQRQTAWLVGSSWSDLNILSYKILTKVYTKCIKNDNLGNFVCATFGGEIDANIFEIFIVLNNLLDIINSNADENDSNDVETFQILSTISFEIPGKLH